MNNSRVAGLVSLSLVAVLIITALAFNLAVDSLPVSAAQLLSDRDAAKQDLIDGTADGRLLYIRSEDYVLDRIGPSEYPDTVILETWLGTDDDGLLSTGVSTTSNVDGVVLLHSRLADGQVVATDVAAEMTFEHKAVNGSLESWLHSVWERPDQVAGEGVRDKGEGSYNDMPSRIYERNIVRREGVDGEETPGLILRVEIVEDAPLFLKQSWLQEDGNGGHVLLRSNKLLSFELLPEGTTPPSF